MNKQVKLKTFDNKTFDKESTIIKRIVWYIINALVFNSGLIFPSQLKRKILIYFGAQIGSGFFIKPYVNIKFPWKLVVGNDVWIGEKVWIDNLDDVIIGDDVCLSQGALLLTGNHNYKLSSFDYINSKIVLEEGVWIGAKSVVCPGVLCKSHSILTVGSTATNNLEEYKIYQGNPAKCIRDREILN